MTKFLFTVNEQERQIETTPERPLLDVVREDLHLTGTKYGCGEGQCRACTVIMEGRPVAACITPVKAVQGKQITTIEGLAKDGKLHRVQQAFLDEGALQCGYCTPGMILRAVTLLESNPNPSEAQVIDALDGNLCRCGGYPRILAAIKRASFSNQTGAK